MYDRETDSLWSHLTGEAIKGSMRGKKLPIVLSVPQIKWGTWKKNYPKTKVLSVGGFEDAGRDAYEKYKKSEDTGLSAPVNRDQRLRPKDMVVGVIVDGKPKAYPFSKFAKSSMIYDKVGDREVLVYRNEASEFTAVYNAYVDGVKVEFERKRVLNDFNVDDKSGTRWNMITGVATEGPRKGRRLERLPHINVYWFAWADYYPKTSLYK